MTVPQQHDNVPDQAPTIDQDVLSLLSDFDLYLFGQGKGYRIYEKMGAHLHTINDIVGVDFALWAPNALSVSIIGDFNDWQHGANPMHFRYQDLGIWECFVPGVSVGALYKYAIASRFNNYTVEKSDPYGFAADWQSCPHSLLLTLAPLSTVILKRQPTERMEAGSTIRQEEV